MKTNKRLTTSTFYKNIVKQFVFVVLFLKLIIILSKEIIFKTQF